MDALAGRRGTTWLITPGTTPTRFASALASGTDVALLDLEDSVPHRQKEQARDTVLTFLAETETAVGGEGRVVLGVRVNALATLHSLRDLTAIAESGACPAVLLIPKVETPRDIDLVAELLEASGGAGGSHPEVWALIETPQAIQQLPQITSSPVLTGVVFGAADYAAAAGCRRTASALRYPRAALANAAAAAGLPAVDSPYFDLDDADGLRRESEEAYDIGFAAKGAVHPRQLPVIRTAFQPSPKELTHAHAVVRAADSPDAAHAITTTDGSMVGPPLVAAARALTTRADSATRAASSPARPHPGETK